MTGPVCQQIKAEVSSLCDALPGWYLIMYEIDIRAFGGSLSLFLSFVLDLSPRSVYLFHSSLCLPLSISPFRFSLVRFPHLPFSARWSRANSMPGQANLSIPLV